MPIEAVIAALSAAVLHAVWNALVKGGGDPLLDLALVWGGSAVLALFALPFVALPVAAAWPYLLLTLFVHMPYGLLLAAAYRAGSLSHVYTVARGSPPLLVALATAALGETLLPGQYLGIAIISFGILLTGFAPHAPLRATLLALCVALTIATYSVLDGLGARASGEPIGYAAWFFVLMGATFAGIVAAWRGPGALAAYAGTNWRRAAIGGPAGALGYGLVLWAMSFAPVAGVSALRETSVAVAAFIGWMFMGDPMSKRRIAGAMLVLAGALVLKLA
ncbi:hypothetical protein sos41_03070 [Alphaproteobacteria bacterium SO-S41]|nr:hypothetical protein sos41_03070 [Alphaproteobacteria bacterium SO-S41]